VLTPFWISTEFAAVLETIVVVPVCADVPTANVPAAVSVENEPVRVVFPVAFPRASDPVPPVAIVVAAAPVALIDAVPTDVRAVTVAAAGTVAPKGGGDANIGVIFDGVRASFGPSVYVYGLTTSVFAARKTIP